MWFAYVPGCLIGERNNLTNLDMETITTSCTIKVGSGADATKTKGFRPDKNPPSVIVWFPCACASGIPSWLAFVILCINVAAKCCTTLWLDMVLKKMDKIGKIVFSCPLYEIWNNCEFFANLMSQIGQVFWKWKWENSLK